MKKIVWCFLSVVLAALFLAPPAPAQFPMPEGRNSNQSESDRDLEERIANMRYLAKLAERRGVKRKLDPKLAIEQLQEDFTRLQIVNKDLVLTSDKSKELDLKFVAKSVVEINKRAERLLSNL